MAVGCACFARALRVQWCIHACVCVRVRQFCMCVLGFRWCNGDSVRACVRALLRVLAYIRVRTHVQVCIEHRLRMARVRATAARHHAHVQPLRHRVGVSPSKWRSETSRIKRPLLDARARACRYDFVRVYAGETTAAPLLGSFSGVSLPPPLAATCAPAYPISAASAGAHVERPMLVLSAARCRHVRGY